MNTSSQKKQIYFFLFVYLFFYNLSWNTWRGNFEDEKHVYFKLCYIEVSLYKIIK